MFLDIFILPIIIFVNIFLGIFVFTKNVKREVNRVFAIFSSSLAIWSLGMLFLAFAPDKIRALQAIPLLHLGLVFIPSSFFNFVIAITQYRSKVNKMLSHIGYTLSLFFLILHFMGLLASDVTYTFGSYRIVGGPASPFFSLTILFYMCYGIFLLYRKYFTVSSYIEKSRYRYLLTGVYLGLIGSISNILRIAGVNIYPFAHLGLFCLNIMIAYSIVKYRLMDITIIIRIGTIYSLGTVLITAVWLLAIFIFEGVLHFQTLHARILTIIIIVFIFQHVREKIQSIVDKRFYRERHNFQELLKKLTKEISTIVEKDTLLTSILNTIQETIHPKYAEIILLDDVEKRYKSEFGLGDYNKSILISEDDNLIKWFKQEKRELLREEIEENPTFDGIREVIRPTVESLRSIVTIPIILKDEIMGILNLGPKLSEKPYSHDEITFLTTLSNEMGFILENTKLYTELKKHTVELEKKAYELKIANESKSNFLNIVSHELRTPLTIIMGYISILSYKALGEITDEQVKCLNIMLEKCRHLNELIGDILDLSKIERGERYKFKKQPVDFKRIVEETILIFTPEALKKQIMLQSEIATNIPMVMYNEELAREIFSKLVDNAIKFIKEDSNGKVTIHLEDKGKYLQGCVEDTGIGIKEENFDKIFERFYQLDMSDTRSYEGTGLGLSIVKEILEDSGGSIKLESEEGKGSKFIFTIPKEEVKEEELPRIRLKKKSPDQTIILMVDDNPDILKLAELYLTSNGYNIKTAKDGVEALDKLYVEKPDLIIFSLKIAKVDGYEFAHILRDHEETKDIPLIMLVPVNEEQNLDKIYKAGATTHLFKPFDFKYLMEKITMLG